MDFGFTGEDLTLILSWLAAEEQENSFDLKDCEVEEAEFDDSS